MSTKAVHPLTTAAIRHVRFTDLDWNWVDEVVQEVVQVRTPQEALDWVKAARWYGHRAVCPAWLPASGACTCGFDAVARLLHTAVARFPVDTLVDMGNDNGLPTSTGSTEPQHSGTVDDASAR